MRRHAESHQIWKAKDEFFCAVMNLAYNVDFCVVQSTATLSAGFQASRKFCSAQKLNR